MNAIPLVHNLQTTEEKRSYYAAQQEGMTAAALEQSVDVCELKDTSLRSAWFEGYSYISRVKETL